MHVRSSMLSNVGACVIFHDDLFDLHLTYSLKFPKGPFALLRPPNEDPIQEYSFLNRHLQVFLLPLQSFFFSEISKCKLDLGLLVDTTKSIKYDNLPKLKEALESLVDEFQISPDGTHVSLETFHSKSTLHNKFNDNSYHSNKAIKDLITNSFNVLKQPTRLDIALKTAKEDMFTKQSGQRPGVRSAMVLYTDGRSHPSTEDFFLEIVALKVSLVLDSFQAT